MKIKIRKLENYEKIQEYVEKQKKYSYGKFGKNISKYKNYLEEICMVKKLERQINQRKIRKVGLVLTSLFFYTNTCFAAIQDSKIVTGTESLISDLTSWLLILAPVLTAMLVGYFFLRKSASDEMDAKRWDNRIKVALISCVGVVVASGLINVIVGYYK